MIWLDVFEKLDYNGYYSCFFPDLGDVSTVNW